MKVARDDGRVWGWGLSGRPWTEEPEPVRFLTSNPKPEPTFLENVVAVAAGSPASYFLCTDGTLWAMGSGDGPFGVSPWEGGVSPQRVMGGVAQVIASGHQSAVVKKDGGLWIWDWWKKDTPPVKLLDNVRSAALCFEHGLALLRDGRLMAWGDNRYGQLGDGTREERRTPVPVSVPDFGDSPVVSLAVAGGLSVVVTADGRLHRWGCSPAAGDSSRFFQCASRLPEENVRAVSLGRKALTLKTDGTLWISDEEHPPELVLEGVAEASAGEFTFLALKKTVPSGCGEIHWESSLGVNTDEYRPRPGRLHFIDEAPPPLSPEWQKMLADKAAQPPVPKPERTTEIQEWGDFLLRGDALWDSDYSAYHPGTDVQEPDGKRHATRRRSEWHDVFFADGVLVGRGENNRGQLGDGTLTDRDAPVPVRMPAGLKAAPSRVSVIATGFEQSGMVMDGVIWLWGQRGMRERGDAPKAVTTPRPLAFAAGEVRDIVLSDGAGILFLTRDGTLWAAGKNGGDLGKPNGNSPKWEEKPFKILTGVESFSYANSRGVVLKKDGTVWEWGCFDDLVKTLSTEEIERYSTPTRLN